MRLKTGLILLSLCFLCGCGKVEEPDVVVQPDLRPVMTEYTWNELSLKGITPVTSFEEQGDEINIYPYNNNEQHISIRKIFISSNNFWSTVTDSYSGTENCIKRDKYTFITFDNQTTVCYFPIDEESAYVLESTLPSGYVDLTAKMLCSIGI